MTTATIVDIRGMVKHFGEVVALDGVDLSLRPGEIHGLLGENGAGKTTLMNVLSGLYRADAGTITLDGHPVVIGAPRDALRAGIGMVHQHFELVPQFTVHENVILGREGRVWLRGGRVRDEVAALAGQYGLTVDLHARVRTLSVGVQQKVEILKALYRGVRVLILDEPTTLLTPQEVDALFGSLRDFTARGLTVIFITHKIREALAACDRITVMRRGRVVATVDRTAVSGERLVELMIGEIPRADATPPATRGAHPALEIHHLAVSDDRRAPAVRDATFTVFPGETVGIAGVAGNGQKELGEALAGVRRPSAGTIRLGDADATNASVRERLARGLALIPEDRIREGILPGMTLAETLVLGPHHFLFPGGGYHRSRAEAVCREAMQEFQIVAPSPSVRAAQLSGGNIQKAVAARAFVLAKAAGSRILLAMHPTRGLDVRATQFLHARLREFARAGGSVLLISEDLDELMQLSDRLLVLYRGTVAAEFARPSFDAYRIGAAMTGVPAAS